MTTYDQALKFVLQWEGGFVDDPADHGGRTMKGVTQSVYDAYLAGKGQAHKDVKNIPEAEVAEIYRNGYWLKAHCDKLASELAFCHFDTAVNMGTNRAIKILQRATGCSDDGVFGEQTLAACAAIDEKKAFTEYCKVRETLYRSFAQRPNQQKFLKGWMNRLTSLRRSLGIGDRGTVIAPEVTERIADQPDGADLGV